MTTYTDRRDASALAVEAFVAGQLPNSIWKSGRQPFDVESGDKKVDVKLAFFESVYDGERAIDALGFMGTNRDIEAREAVTHYALVIPPVEEVTVVAAQDGSVTSHMARPETWFLIPREELNAHFGQKCNRLGNRTGLNKYCAVDVASRWEQVTAP